MEQLADFLGGAGGGMDPATPLTVSFPPYPCATKLGGIGQERGHGGVFLPGQARHFLADSSPLCVAGDTRDFEWATGDNGVPVLAKKKTSTKGALKSFLCDVPSAVVFSAAWGLLHGLSHHSPLALAEAHAALRHHEFWVL